MSYPLRSLNLLAGILAFTLSTGFGDRVYFLNEEGNRAYREEQYEESLKKYREAQMENPDSGSILYNVGNVYYRQGNFDKAAAEYGLALQKDPPDIRTDSLFNRGNALFRAGEADRRAAALDSARENYMAAIGSYRQALLLNPDDQESKFNLELAQRRLKELEKKQKEQEKQKDQEQDRDQQQSKQEQDQTGEQKDQPQEPQQPQSESGEKERESKGEPENEKQSPADQYEGTPPEMKQMTREEAETILQALKNDERKVQEFLRKVEPTDKSVEKDW
jgi:tetratricopeptide (TPR) repeat protein